MKKSLIIGFIFLSLGLPRLARADGDEIPTRVKAFNHYLADREYAGDLTAPGKVRNTAKGTTAAGTFRVTLWMYSDEDVRMHDAQQIKFSAYRCSDSTTSPEAFRAQATKEIQALFPKLTGERAPKRLIDDLPTLTLDQPKFYSARGFKNVRMNDQSLKCGALDGDSLEVDFFR